MQERSFEMETSSRWGSQLVSLTWPFEESNHAIIFSVNTLININVPDKVGEKQTQKKGQQLHGPSPTESQWLLTHKVGGSNCYGTRIVLNSVLHMLYCAKVTEQPGCPHARCMWQSQAQLLSMPPQAKALEKRRLCPGHGFQQVELPDKIKDRVPS